MTYIVAPWPVSVIGGSFTNPERLLTPDPKEIAVCAIADCYVDIDLGQNREVGAIYFGGMKFYHGWPFVTGGLSGGAYTDFSLSAIAGAPRRVNSGPYQALSVFTPRPVRYLRIGTNYGVGVEAGVVAVGELFAPQYGHEWGAGRGLVDTGSATRNRAGGFGIEKGAIVPTWDFTLGDLADEEREQLFEMMRRTGETSPVIVAEDIVPVDANLDGKIHYGLFQRLEKYERQQLGVTRWSLKVEEWI